MLKRLRSNANRSFWRVVEAYADELSVAADRDRDGTGEALIAAIRLQAIEELRRRLLADQSIPPGLLPSPASAPSAPAASEPAG